MDTNDVRIKQLESDLEHKEIMIHLLKENIEVLESSIKIIEDTYVLATGVAEYKRRYLKIIR